MYTGLVCEVEHRKGFITPGVKRDCYAHGICQQGTCQCAPGWGKKPERKGRNGCQDAICFGGCGGHGGCDQGWCVCEQGWTGPNCKDPDCPSDCSGHGMCTFVSPSGPGQCICDWGWAGGGCQRVALYNSDHGLEP